MRHKLSSAYWSGRPVVYRLYGDGGRLFYIGSTNHLARRISEHIGWWTELIDQVKVQVFPTLEAARAAEAVAIQEEQSLINVMGTGRPAADKSWPNWTALDHARADAYSSYRAPRRHVVVSA